MKVYDLIGIGFGPSNIALAIALDEQRQLGKDIDALFIEKQDQFAWHKDMLLENADMQISFLKDLVTLRNPRSRFTFTNYLFEKGRLQDFINLKTFFPSRQEFNDYLSWSARQFEDCCAYHEEVLEIIPEKRDDEVSLLRVKTQNHAGTTRERLARNLVISTGGGANIPECFRDLKKDTRVFHSSNYLSSINQLTGARRIAVIGAGQSAAEIFLDLHGRSNDLKIDLIMRARAMHPSDDSPSVNEIFNVEFTDYMFSRSPEEREKLLAEFRHTNYAAPDIDQIQQIFKILYAQKVSGCTRHRLFCHYETRSVSATPEDIRLTLQNLDTHQLLDEGYDAVVLATGYTRTQHKTLLAPVASYLSEFAVDRHYRLASAPQFKPAIFLQGACENTHGISDTLLSVMALRTREIGDALANVVHKKRDALHKQSLTA